MYFASISVSVMDVTVICMQSYLYLFKFLLYINKFGLHFECVACVQAVFLGCILQPDVYTLVIRTPQENYICICIVSGYKFLSSYVVKLLEKMTNLAGILAFLDGNKFRKVTRSTLGKAIMCGFYLCWEKVLLSKSLKFEVLLFLSNNDNVSDHRY